MEEDRLGEDGCCLVCVECGDCGRPCPSCVCSKCDWYNENATGLKCQYLRFKEGKLELGGTIIEKETEKAVLVRDNEFGENWFPKSQIEFGKNRNSVKIPRWLLEKKGWLMNDDWDFLGGKTFEEYEKDKLERKTFEPSLKDDKIRYGG